MATAGGNRHGAPGPGGGRGGAPPPPPPPGSGGRGRHGGGGRNNGTGRSNRTRGYRINLALTNLQNALIDKGFNANEAFRFARMALTQKGVEIGRDGKVHYKGGLYDASQFVNNPLIQYVTGAKAKAANEATLKADPNYQSALANLGLVRDQQQSALDAQRNQALLEFGDPTFVQNNPLLAAQAGANQFGTSQLLQQGYDQQRQQAQRGVEAAGTLFGGGAQSAALAGQHAFAGQQQQAVSSLQNLLSGLTMQRAQADQSYSLGQQNALLQTQQNLAAEGRLSASRPKLKFGTYNLWGGLGRPGGGGGGHGGGGGGGGGRRIGPLGGYPVSPLRQLTSG